MSADNGYIVMEKGGQYGVSYYNASCYGESGSEYDRNDIYRRSLWDNSKKFANRAEALEYAHDLAKEDWTEYGVSEDKLPDWERIDAEAAN